MRRLPLIILFTALATAAGPRVTRVSLEAMERSFDTRIGKIDIALPFDLLGSTRGLYLEGYGAVFSAEVSLIITSPLSPFHTSITKDEVARVHARKLQRVPLLKRNMREMLGAMASSLDTVPSNEQIVLAVSLFYYNWEDRGSLPQQIVMQGQRQKLIDAQLGRVPFDSVIKVQEL